MDKHLDPDNSTLPLPLVETMNLVFPHPVGLAAGFDRDGRLLSSLISVGFGFIEIGTINVNSEIDVDENFENIINNIQQSKKQSANQALIGISLGSLRNSIDDCTVADYIKGMEIFWHCADYIVINLSRPGSSMRSEDNINSGSRVLLERIKQAHTLLCDKYHAHLPIVVKIAIGYKNRTTLPETLTIAYELKYDGLLIAFENWPSIADVITTVGRISVLTNNLPQIVVGGIKTKIDVSKILNAGAKLVQCYTLFVEQKPSEIKKIITNIF